jgi:HPt (histidine-containing phosphotransfer) domain-containing protein
VADARRISPEDLARLYAQFAEGLPARAAVMREALDALSAGASVHAATRLYMAAHALRGTAHVYGALDLVPHAERLERWSNEWQRAGRVDATALAEARRELDRLVAAMVVAGQRGAQGKPR